MSADVMAIMARSPDRARHTIKTRLSGVVPDLELRVALYRAFLADTIALARSLSHVSLRVALTPEGGDDGLDALGVHPEERCLQRGDDLGARQRQLFQQLFAQGSERVVVVGSDLPGLAGAVLVSAFETLRQTPSAVVLGPAEDGGYYLMGLAGGCQGAPAIPDLFTGIRWSTPDALDDTMAAARRAGRHVHLLSTWFDVDDADGFERLRRESMSASFASRAPATARWLAHNL
jgi:rSAM/selenodomain-associated transferase 1